MPDKTLDALQKKVRAPGAPIKTGCRSKDPDCDSERWPKIRKRLADRARQKPVRILHLGDSHVAADYITSRIRRDLQAVYGDGGRGFVHPDQAWGYGGRRVGKSDDWVRERIVDGGRRIGRPYGFSGNSITARKRNASVYYRVRPEDRSVRLFFRPKRNQRVSVYLDKKKLGRFKLSKTSGTIEIPLPDRKPRRYRRGPSGNTLRIRADSVGASLYGLSFEGKSSGLQY
ncbi:MAG: hypothetical protein AAF399_09490, partial [Bacteroidota bacterium]